MGYANRNTFMFGTQQHFEYLIPPQRGADTSPVGWGTDGTLLSGGGFALNSFGSHKRYTFEWGGAAAPEAAQIMKSYSDGSFGRGLLYFHDPVTYRRNVLPAQWADPSMSVGYEGTSLVYGVEPEAVPTSDFQANRLPVRSAFYNLNRTTPGYRGPADSVFIPVPVGHVLYLGAFYQSTGTGGVFVSRMTPDDSVLSEGRVPELGNSESGSIHNFPGGIGDVPGSRLVRIWVGREDNTPSSVTIAALTARLVPLATANVRDLMGPWVGGMGHSGVRFAGKPTFISNSSVIGGGQVSYAASFIETGSWAYG